MCEGEEGGGARRPAGAAGDYVSRGGGAGEAALAAVVHEAVLAAAVRHEVRRLLLQCAPVAHLLRHHLQPMKFTPVRLLTCKLDNCSQHQNSGTPQGYFHFSERPSCGFLVVVQAV